MTRINSKLHFAKLILFLLLTNALAAQPSGSDITLTIISNPPSCNKDYGSIIVTAAGGTAPYKFQIGNSRIQNNGNFIFLKAGDYEITVTDAAGKVTRQQATLTQVDFPPRLNVVTGTRTSGCTTADASITLGASGGTPPYQYSMDYINYQASNTFTGLTGGFYTFFVKDANGCIGSTQPGPLGAFFDLSCYENIRSTYTTQTCGNNGSIIVEVDSPNPPYTYSIDGINYQSTGGFNGLAPGIYRIYIKDRYGDIKLFTYSIYPRCDIIIKSVTISSACGVADGSLTLTAENGTAPYTYTIDGINYQEDNKFDGLSPGIYIVTARDAEGVTNSSEIIIYDKCPLTVTTNVVNAGCGKNDGQVTVYVSDGTPSFKYSLDGINFQFSNSFKNLASGTYTISVKDKLGKTGDAVFEIKSTGGPEINVIAEAASCNNNDGKVTITASAGTLPYQYTLDGNFQTAHTFNNLAAGEYTAAIKDANGCTSSELITVALQNNLELNMGDDITICESKGINLPVSSNATAFVWLPLPGLDNVNSKSPFASPDVTTKYYVNANSGSCSKNDSITVFVNPAPVANAGSNATICFGQSVQLNGSGGENFSWTPATNLDDPYSSNPMVVKPVASVSYSLYVSDANGCSSVQPSTVTINVTPPAKVFAGRDTSITINESLQLNAIDVNNSNFVSYTWSPAYGLNNAHIQNPVAISDKEMTYSVKASTQAGCEGFDTIKIKVYQEPEIYVPTAFTPNNDGKNDMLKAIPVGIREFKFFTIYNRWGNRIFHSTDPKTGWDGKFRNTDADTGVYVWIAEGKDSKGKVITRKGSVILIR